MPQITLSKSELVVMIKASVPEWNKYRRNRFGPIDLSRADLSWTNLMAANLTEVDLSHSYLIGANLTGANLTDAILHNSDVRGAVYMHATMTHSQVELFERSQRSTINFTD
jgi:uncharacterized protein YjbI with pentapeptide repeats